MGKASRRQYYREANYKPAEDFPGQVLDILHWRDPKKSAIALAASLLFLIALAKFSVLSLLAWTSLIVITATLGFRIFKVIQGQVQKTDATNPFKPYLEKEINLPQEKVHAQADVFVDYLQTLINQGRRLFLVENIIDSSKFAVMLYTLTYVSSWFSGIALLTIFVLGLFSIPKVYEIYQEPIDQYVGLAKENVSKVNNTLQERLPFLKQEVKQQKTE